MILQMIFTAIKSGKIFLTEKFNQYLTKYRSFYKAFPGIRTDSNHIQFNRHLKRCDYDLAEWRKLATPELRRGFQLIDLDGGIGWELLISMVQYRARQRTSAKATLAHPSFDREGLLALISYAETQTTEFSGNS